MINFSIPEECVEIVYGKICQRISALPFVERMSYILSRECMPEIHTKDGREIVLYVSGSYFTFSGAIIVDVAYVKNEHLEEVEKLMFTSYEVAQIVGIVMEETKLKYKKVDGVWYEKERWWKPL